MSSFLKSLMEKKDSIEKDISMWFDILASQGNVGMKSPLVDSDGFPRNDIDLFQVRTARHNINCLQNDHKAIMKQIQQGLVEYHKQVRESTNDNMETSTSTLEQDSVTNVTETIESFAHVGEVTENSPAHNAGLQTGDQILKFGSVTKTNFTNMNSIAEVVKHSQGKSLKVLVKQSDNSILTLTLVPSVWSGKGLLGCSIIPN